MQHLHQQYLPGLPKVVEVMALWLEPISPKTTLPVKFLQAPHTWSWPESMKEAQELIKHQDAPATNVL